MHFLLHVPPSVYLLQPGDSPWQHTLAGAPSGLLWDVELMAVSLCCLLEACLAIELQVENHSYFICLFFAQLLKAAKLVQSMGSQQWR